MGPGPLKSSCEHIWSSCRSPGVQTRSSFKGALCRVPGLIQQRTQSPGWSVLQQIPAPCAFNLEQLLMIPLPEIRSFAESLGSEHKPFFSGLEARWEGLKLCCCWTPWGKTLLRFTAVRAGLEPGDRGKFSTAKEMFSFIFFKTYLITKLVSKLKCFLQVNKDILRYAFRSWECFILRRAGAWILKNGPKNALNSNYRHSSIVIPTPLPNKLLPFTLKGAQGPRKVWYPKQSLDVWSCLLSRWEARNNKLKGLCGCVQPPWITQPIFCSLSRKLHLLFPHWQGFSSIYPAECDILRGRTGIPQTRSSFAEKGTSIIHQITPNIIPIHCPCRFLFKAPAVSAFSLGDKHKRLIPVRSGIVCVKQGNPALKRLLPQHVQNNNNKYYD